MRDCSGDVAGLPACTTPSRPFTEADLMAALKQTYEPFTDCSITPQTCDHVFNTIHAAGYLLTDMIVTMRASFNIPFHTLGVLLREFYVKYDADYSLREESPHDMVALIKNAGMAATPGDIAAALRGGRFAERHVVKALELGLDLKSARQIAGDEGRGL